MQSLLIHTSSIWAAIDTKRVFAMRKNILSSMTKILTSILIKASYINSPSTEDLKFYISEGATI